MTIRFISWMLLTTPMAIMLMWAYVVLAEDAARHGWRFIKSDLILFMLLFVCFGLGLFLTFRNG